MILQRQSCAKTNLPVEADGKKTEPFITVTSTKHSGDSRVVRYGKAKDRQAGEKGEHPLREDFPNKDPGDVEVSLR